MRLDLRDKNTKIGDTIFTVVGIIWLIVIIILFLHFTGIIHLP